MKRCFSLFLLTVVFSTMASALSALDLKSLENDMWKLAAVNAWLDAACHPGVPVGAVILKNLPLKIKESGELKTQIQGQIGVISTPADFGAVQVLIEKFRKLGGFEREVAFWVENLLSKRARFEAIHESK